MDDINYDFVDMEDTIDQFEVSNVCYDDELYDMGIKNSIFT